MEITIHADIPHRGSFHRRVHCLVSRVLVDKRAWGIRLLLCEGIGVLKMMRFQHLLMESIHLDGRSSVKASFGSGHRQGRPYMDSHARRMEIARLAVVKRVGSTGGRCVVPWRLVCERGKCEGVGVKERRSKSPRFIRSPRGRIRVLVLELILIAKSPIPHRLISCLLQSTRANMRCFMRITRIMRQPPERASTVQNETSNFTANASQSGSITCGSSSDR